jgi:hypothetical protein
MTLQAPLVKGEKKQRRKNMSAVKKKETCEEQLRRMVKEHCERHHQRRRRRCQVDGKHIRHQVTRGPGEAFPGRRDPGSWRRAYIWVDTFREQVTGWWGTDRVQWYFQDNLGLNDYCEEMYGY